MGALLCEYKRMYLRQKLPSKQPRTFFCASLCAACCGLFKRQDPLERNTPLLEAPIDAPVGQNLSTAAPDVVALTDVKQTESKPEDADAMSPGSALTAKQAASLDSGTAVERQHNESSPDEPSTPSYSAGASSVKNSPRTGTSDGGAETAISSNAQEHVATAAVTQQIATSSTKISLMFSDVATAACIAQSAVAASALPQGVASTEAGQIAEEADVEGDFTERTALTQGKRLSCTAVDAVSGLYASSGSGVPKASTGVQAAGASGKGSKKKRGGKGKR